MDCSSLKPLRWLLIEVLTDLNEAEMHSSVPVSYAHTHTRTQIYTRTHTLANTLAHVACKQNEHNVQLINIQIKTDICLQNVC